MRVVGSHRVLALLVALLVAGSVQVQGYPAKTIR